VGEELRLDLIKKVFNLTQLLIKSKDDDYDGVDDLSDPDLTPFQQTWEKYLNKSLYSSYSK